VPRFDIVTFGGDPAQAPALANVDLFGAGGFVKVKVAPGTNSLDAIVSAPAGVALDARLFDSHGVMVGESQPLGGNAPPGAHSAGGLAPQGRLTVPAVQAGKSYTLLLVPSPGSVVPPGGKTKIALGAA
jgi:hypothetical protein